MQDRLVRTRIAGTRKSVLLLGPRQVGKSTLCRALTPDVTVDLADERTYLSYAKDPSLLRSELAARGGTGLIFVDEVQRLPSLLNTVQSILDNPAGSYRFLLTGSSARKLRRRGVNLLPGRVILEHLDPLTYLEVRDRFDLDRAMQVGMLPGIYLGDEEAVNVLETYAEVYLREEIRAEAAVKNLGDYARFLDTAAVLSGQWLNYSKISSETEIPKETIRRYIRLLEDTLLVFRIPPFRPRRKISRRISQRDKFILFDIGVRNALLALHRHRVSQDQVGSVFEQWFTLQVIYANRALRKGWKLSAYRTERGAEVDLVVERDDDIIGLEIKAGRTISAAETRGLSSLAETVGRYKPVRKWAVYRGDRRLVLHNGVNVYPYREALSELAGL